MSEGPKHNWIQDLEVQELRPPETAIVFIQISIDKKVNYKTDPFKVEHASSVAKWSLNLKISFDASTSVHFTLYHHKHFLDVPLGTTQISATDIFGGAEDYKVVSLIRNASPPSVVARLKIRHSENTGLKKYPTELSQVTSKITIPSFRRNRISEVNKMIDTLAEFLPVANVAWNFLSVRINLLRNKRDTDSFVIKLYETMLSTYEHASRYEVLRNHRSLQRVYEALFKQTNECTFFIVTYTKRRAGGHPRTLDSHAAPRVVDVLRLSVKAAEFGVAFQYLTKQLRSSSSDVRVLTWGAAEAVNMPAIQQLLLSLRPPAQLHPRSACLQGTRVQIINDVMDWIADCSGGMLWCTGVAGTGKSAIMGTLHQFSNSSAFGRDRLGSFIRYDRTEYTDSSKLITSIAYSLALFDGRIERAIVQAVRKIGPVLPPSPRVLFDRLLREPLRSVPDLLHEGPVVVIIDGLDESDASDEILRLLAEGFGPELPFMRLIVSSRSLRRISAIFGHSSSVVPLTLDTSSKQVHSDIRTYIERQFSNIYTRDLKGYQAKRFRELCHDLDAIEKITQRANGLFVWADVVCRSIADFPSKSRLHALLGDHIPRDIMQPMTNLYQTALNAIASDRHPNSESVRVKHGVRALLGAVVVAETPPGLTPENFYALVLDGDDTLGHYTLSDVASIVEFASEKDRIQLMHVSFKEFLVDPQRHRDNWFIDVRRHERDLARRCLSSLNTFLRSWRSLVDKYRNRVPAHIRDYAILGPLWHIHCFDGADADLIRTLFNEYFLSWMEVIIKLGSQHLEWFLSSIFGAMTKMQESSIANGDIYCSVYDAAEAAEMIVSDLLQSRSITPIMSSGVRPTDIYSSLRNLPPHNAIRNALSPRQKPDGAVEPAFSNIQLRKEAFPTKRGRETLWRLRELKGFQPVVPEYWLKAEELRRSIPDILNRVIRPGTRTASEKLTPQTIPDRKRYPQRRKSVKAITKHNQGHGAIVTALDSLEPLKKMINMLAEVHPAAEISLNIVSIGFNVLKKQKEGNQLAFALYGTMLNAYLIASEDEILRRRDQLRRIYECLFEQTIECSYFIEGYLKKRDTERLFTLNLSDKANEFCEGFTYLCNQLHDDVVKEGRVVALGIQKQAKKMSRRDLIRDLRPSTALRPKSTYMKGTCVEAINYLMSWIAQCSGGMLWCKDLVGMGTSSLAGMLHDLLTVHISTRKRLGAFVRYDRVEYSDASHLIMSIAYSLGMSDNRIGAAISKVIGRNRAVLSMAPSEQFRLLLKGPLESLRVLANEGPLVVVIDGIEECDPSNEMLAVLSRGFGQRLPFMRLLVFSRPTELLSRAFTAPNSAVTTFILDTASIQAGCDIESASVW